MENVFLRSPVYAKAHFLFYPCTGVTVPDYGGSGSSAARKPAPSKALTRKNIFRR